MINDSMMRTIREEYRSGRLSMEEISDRLRIGMPILRNIITSSDKKARRDSIARIRAQRIVDAKRNGTFATSQSGILTTIEDMLGRKVR